MNIFKKISGYKLINIILFALVFVMLLFMYLTYSNWCEGKDVYCYYNFYDAIFNPMYSGGKILAVILATLLFVPSHIFRKWLIFVAPVIILITINRVIAVSVYASGIGTIDKIHMAQLGMYFLGIVTALFVAGHLMYDRRKNKLVK